MKAADEVIEVNREELQGLLERKRETLGEEDYQKLQKLLRAFSYLADLIGEKETTISQLRALLMKPSRRAWKPLGRIHPRGSPRTRSRNRGTDGMVRRRIVALCGFRSRTVP